MKASNTFAASPLITPERVKASPCEAFAILPDWAAGASREGDRMHLVVGKTHRKAIHMPDAEFAVSMEISRFRIRMVTNTNGRTGSVLARWYVKFSISGAAQSNMPVRRVFSGAGEGVETKALEIESDYSAANVAFAPDAKSKWDARNVILREARRLANENAPDGFDVDAYIDNIKRWFAEIDRSLEPHSAPAE